MTIKPDPVKILSIFREASQNPLPDGFEQWPLDHLCILSNSTGEVMGEYVDWVNNSKECALEPRSKSRWTPERMAVLQGFQEKYEAIQRSIQPYADEGHVGTTERTVGARRN